MACILNSTTIGPKSYIASAVTVCELTNSGWEWTPQQHVCACTRPKAQPADPTCCEGCHTDTTAGSGGRDKRGQVSWPVQWSKPKLTRLMRWSFARVSSSTALWWRRVPYYVLPPPPTPIRKHKIKQNAAASGSWTLTLSMSNATAVQVSGLNLEDAINTMCAQLSLLLGSVDTGLISVGEVICWKQCLGSKGTADCWLYLCYKSHLTPACTTSHFHLISQVSINLLGPYC